MEQVGDHRNGSGAAGHVEDSSDTVDPIPTALRSADTYLIFSEVSYIYVPTVGYVMAKAGITLSDFTYTRPRSRPA